MFVIIGSKESKANIRKKLHWNWLHFLYVNVQAADTPRDTLFLKAHYQVHEQILTWKNLAKWQIANWLSSKVKTCQFVNCNGCIPVEWQSDWCKIISKHSIKSEFSQLEIAFINTFPILLKWAPNSKDKFAICLDLSN